MKHLLILLTILSAPICASLLRTPVAEGIKWFGSKQIQSQAPHDELNATSSLCCTELQRVVNGAVSYPGDDVYAAQSTGFPDSGYWSLQESDLLPPCRITPSSSAQLGQVVRTLASSNCQFAIRSGGHTAFAGAANIASNGVTIDLSSLASITISNDKAIASVGPGARWGNVYTRLGPDNLAVSGGRVASVGVGGLTLGGGKSFFASRRGFVCDGVRNFELVTATGGILDVNDTSYPDLFKALKGGSNNFGIVSRFDLQTFRQGELWGGQFLYPPEALDAGLDALYEFTEATGAEQYPTEDAQVIFASTSSRTPAGTPAKTVSAFLSYSRPDPFPPIFNNFTKLELQISNSARVSNLTDFGQELNAGTPNGKRYLFATATFKNNLQMMKELLNVSDATFGSLYDKNVSGLSPSTVLQPLTRPMLQHGCGKNSLGLCPSESNLMILDLTVSWENVYDDFVVEDAATRLVRWTTARSRELGASSNFIYLNYAQSNQKPFIGYGKAAHEALKRASAKYDPAGVFQRLVPGGFKL